MNKRLWLKTAAGLSFFMASCQTVISLSPAIAAYFGAPLHHSCRTACSYFLLERELR